MIGTFWNMCRACPSVPVDKFHSEYRSTYRWHEYTGPKQEVVRRPPQGFSAGHFLEPPLPRRKKHPELAYKAHEFLCDSGSEALLDKSFLNERARSEERWASSREKNSRRSKSEGPPRGKSTYSLISTKPINIPNQSSTCSKNRNSFFYDKNEAAHYTPGFSNVAHREILRTEPPKKEENRIKYPYSNILNPRIDEIYSQNAPKKSVSMNGLKNKESKSQETVPVHRQSAALKNRSDIEVLQPSRTNTDSDNNTKEDLTSKYNEYDGEFKSEYKKNFQPFNRYDYDENKGIFEKRPITVTDSTDCYDGKSQSSSWYKEVVHLRQQANQYRHRGWGTELVPEHIAQLYNDQIMVWEQVSRRSHLSALSLASSVVTRNETASRNDKENRKSSPIKSLTRAKSAKASHTISTHHTKPEKKKGSTAKPQGEHSPKKGNIQVKKLGIRRTSPNRTIRDSGVGAPLAIHKPDNEGLEKQKRRPRPTSLIASAPSASKSVQSKKKEKNDTEIEDFPSLVHEQIVKSPPEPTRVKSPEQVVIRSPEPVNWTVPLDTGKTFTVTQNIREGDLAPRSYSDVRAWTPNSAPPPPASVSAPTELLDINKVNFKEEILTK